MKTRLQEILERQTAIRAELLEIEELTEPTDEDSTRQDTLLDENDTLDVEAKPLAERAERLANVRAVAERAATADPSSPEAARMVPGFQAPEVIVKKDPFEHMDAVRYGQIKPEDMRSRALAAVEQSTWASDDYREAATGLIGRVTGADRHALLTGSPAYRSAFEKIIQYPQTFAAMLTLEEAESFRAAMSTTVGNGGYAIPFLLDPTIILTNGGVTNPFRTIATVKQGTSNVWHGLTSAGVTAEWKAEGAAAGDGSPTLTQPAITAQLADAFVFGSYEVFEDTDLATELPMLIGDAKDRLEADAFVVGSGSGAPKGVVTAVTAITASRVAATTAGTFTSASRVDVDKVIVAVPPRHRSVASWVANYAIYDIIRTMDTAGGGSFWANLGANQPEQLLGRPNFESSQMASAVTTGSNILLAGNFKNYVIYDRIGMSLEYIPNIFDTTTGRPTGQRGWFATWRVGADVVNADAFRVLKL